MEIAQFFAETLPALAARHAATFGARRGSIAILILGHPGWTIQLGNREQPVLEQPRIDADLALRVTEQGFQSLLAGSLDVAAAIKNQTVVADGDLSLLETFGFFLSGAGSSHQIRGAD